MTFELQSYLKSRRDKVEHALNIYLPSLDAQPTRLHDSMRYSVLASGKRLRPILVFAGAEAVGGNPDDVILTACALECIHVFSLIHDDLPCMDNDDYRRGRLTNHKVYGDAMALLAGDALQAFAFQLIAENVATVPAERLIPVIHLIAKASGTWGMVGGQVVDMESEKQDNVSPETLHYIHTHKTGALLTASVLSGAMLCGGTPEQIAALSRFGGHVGLAFQIADDILDVIGDEVLIGKPVGSDIANDKATYPKLFGLEESRRRAYEEMNLAVESLVDFGEKAEPLRAIAHYIVERNL